MSGNADLRIPIRGPDGKGTLFVEAWKQNGVWEYYTLAVEIAETGKILTLDP